MKASRQLLQNKIESTRGDLMGEKLTSHSESPQDIAQTLMSAVSSLLDVTAQPDAFFVEMGTDSHRPSRSRSHPLTLILALALTPTVTLSLPPTLILTISFAFTLPRPPPLYS